MRRAFLPGLVAALAMSGVALAAPAVSTEKAIAPAPTKETARKKKKLFRAPSGYLFRPIRSRGPQAPKKKRPNRNHIGRRVRRKHRRAA